MNKIYFGVDSIVTQNNSYDKVKIKSIVAMENYGFTKSWYGGKIKCVAKLEDSVLKLIVGNKNQTLDVFIAEEEYPEYLASLMLRELRGHAKGKGIRLNSGMTQEDIIAKLLE